MSAFSLLLLGFLVGLGGALSLLTVAEKDLGDACSSQRREDGLRLENETDGFLFVPERVQNSGDVEPRQRSLDEGFSGRRDPEDLECVHMTHESSVRIILDDAEVKAERIELRCLMVGWIIITCWSNHRVSICSTGTVCLLQNTEEDLVLARRPLVERITFQRFHVPVSFMCIERRIGV